MGLHRDDDQRNNALTNLYWGTGSENSVDQVRNGNHPNARKVLCKRKHNDWYIRPNGARCCRTCGRDQKRAKAGRV